MTWHASIPWKSVRMLYRHFRKKFFTTPRPTGPYYRVNASKEDIIDYFGRGSWSPNWEFSYHKKGEDINLAYVFYDPDVAGPDWWQYHLRGWQVEGDVYDLRCHFEPEPTEHPKAHLEGTKYAIGEGMRELRRNLEGMGAEYAKYTRSTEGVMRQV